MAKIINTYWFEEGSVCKIGASLKDYINDKGSWKFLDEYKTFLNEHTIKKIDKISVIKNLQKIFEKNIRFY